MMEDKRIAFTREVFTLLEKYPFMGDYSTPKILRAIADIIDHHGPENPDVIVKIVQEK